MIIPRREAETGPFRSVWRKWNELRDYCQAITLQPGINVKIARTNYGSRISAELSEKSESTELKPFLVKFVRADYLVCRSYNDEVEGPANEYIALDWELRRTPFDNKTITFTAEQPTESLKVTYVYQSNTYRTATIKTAADEVRTTESQQIIPLFIPDKTIIFAMKYTKDEQIIITPPDDTTGSISMIALASGRAWAKV